MSSTSDEVTQLLLDWSGGDRAALDRLMPLVYDELRRLAARFLRREGPGHTLQTTALVHEAYLRLIDQKRVQWQNRAHFFAIAAQLMRRIVIDHARAGQYAKRGSGAPTLSLNEAVTLTTERAAELVALDDALTALAAGDARKCRVVELKFFGGLTTDETAFVLELSTRTVEREWNLAQAWLYREMNRAAT